MIRFVSGRDKSNHYPANFFGIAEVLKNQVELQKEVLHHHFLNRKEVVYGITKTNSGISRSPI